MIFFFLLNKPNIVTIRYSKKNIPIGDPWRPGVLNRQKLRLKISNDYILANTNFIEFILLFLNYPI